MQVTVSDKMKKWTAAYIRSHRADGYIGIHVVYSKFNVDFRTQFKTDPRIAIQLMEHSGFLKGKPAKGGYTIWLPEDETYPHKATNGTAKSRNTSEEQTCNHQKGPQMSENGNDGQDITHYKFEKVPHPETGEVNILELIRFVMARLSEVAAPNAEQDGAYVLVNVSLTDFFASLNIPSGSRPSLSRIMQEMALIRSYERGLWAVLPANLADGFITHEIYLSGRQAMLDRQYKTNERSRFVRQIEQLKKDSGGKQTQTKKAKKDESADVVSYEAEAVEALAEAEQLAEQLDAAKKRIAELEAELESRPSDGEAAKVALQERLAALKQRKR